MDHPKILIIEDEIAFAERLVLALEDMASVRVVPTVLDARRIIEKDPPEVVLAELDPESEISARLFDLLQQFPKIARVAITANAELAIEQMAQHNIYIDGLVTQPLRDPALLRDAIQQARQRAFTRRDPSA